MMRKITDMMTGRHEARIFLMQLSVYPNELSDLISTREYMNANRDD